MNSTITPDPIFNSGTAQTPQQLAASATAANGGVAPTTGPGSADPTIAPPNQTQDASSINNQMSGNSTGVIFPPAPGAPTTGVSNNVGIPNPTSAADIISQGTQQTPAEATNQTLLQKVAALIGGGKGQTELTNTAEAAAGLPALNQTRQVYADQLEGITNQSLDLQNQATPGGAIQNAEQQDALGRGITAGGLAPLTAEDLRKNQIQQSALASHALTLKSQIYAIDGKISLAKDAADRAATSAFEAQQRQIDYQTALIKANEPSMTKQEQAQADLVKQNLADRQAKINLQIDNYKTGQGAIADALKNNPNDPQAQYAAQQATKLDPNDPNYLQKVQALVGQYGSDLAKRALDMSLQNANLEETRLKIKSDRLNLGLDPSTGKPLAGSGGGAIPSNLQPYYKTSYDGTPYVDLSSLSGAQKNQYAQIASANGIKPILNTEDADKISHIAVAKSNLVDIMNAFNSVPVQNDLADKYFSPARGATNSLKNLLGDPTVRAYQNYRTSAINTLQALAGGQGSGFRITQSEITAAIADIPVLTGVYADTPASAQKKIDNLNAQIDKWQTQIMGGGNHPSNQSQPEPSNHAKGTAWQRSDGVYVSDGNSWVKQ